MRAKENNQLPSGNKIVQVTFNFFCVVKQTFVSAAIYWLKTSKLFNKNNLMRRRQCVTKRIGEQAGLAYAR